MRKPILGFLIAALALGLTVGTVHAAKAKKARSQVEIEWHIGAAFIGDVHSQKNKCERNRTVTLTHEDDGEVDVVGTATTDRTGDWAIPGQLDFNAPFVAEVERKKVGKGDKKLVCKAADSPPISFAA